MRMMILAGRPVSGGGLSREGLAALLRNFKRSAHTFIEFDLLPSIRLRILYGRIPSADLAPLLFTTNATKPETAPKLLSHLSSEPTGGRPRWALRRCASVVKWRRGGLIN